MERALPDRGCLLSAPLPQLRVLTRSLTLLAPCTSFLELLRQICTGQELGQKLPPPVLEAKTPRWALLPSGAPGGAPGPRSSWWLRLPASGRTAHTWRRASAPPSAVCTSPSLLRVCAGNLPPPLPHGPGGLHWAHLGAPGPSSRLNVLHLGTLAKTIFFCHIR